MPVDILCRSQSPLMIFHSLVFLPAGKSLLKLADGTCLNTRVCRHPGCGRPMLLQASGTGVFGRLKQLQGTGRGSAPGPGLNDGRPYPGRAHSC